MLCRWPGERATELLAARQGPYPAGAVVAAGHQEGATGDAGGSPRGYAQGATAHRRSERLITREVPDMEGLAVAPAAPSVRAATSTRKVSRPGTGLWAWP
ncbi:hypothetical protein JCM4914_71680 [Streptomyces platensis subsp. malvinus]